MTQLFLYGLFMDIEALASMGLSPEVKGKALLTDYRIQVADRATLVPAKDSTAYGLLV